MCVTYVIVRVGEWTMVMLGETVLSLLGVPLDNSISSYLMFLCSMFIAGNLQFQCYTVHPIHAEHHVLYGGQFNFKGLLYLIWATIWYATMLVVIGASAKVLTKKASYGLVYHGANWGLLGGVAATYVSVITFSSLHHRHESKGLGILDCFTSSYALSTAKGGSSTCAGSDEITLSNALYDAAKCALVLVLLGAGFAELEPSQTVFGCYFVAVAQSVLVVYENSSGLEDPEDLDGDDDGPNERVMDQKTPKKSPLIAKLQAVVFLARPNMNRSSTSPKRSVGEAATSLDSKNQRRSSRFFSPPGTSF